MNLYAILAHTTHYTHTVMSPTSPSKESWDDDFEGDVADDVLLASMSSAAGPNGFYQRSLNASGTSMSTSVSTSASVVSYADGPKSRTRPLDEFDALESEIQTMQGANSKTDLKSHRHRQTNENEYRYGEPEKYGYQRSNKDDNIQQPGYKDETVRYSKRMSLNNDTLNLMERMSTQDDHENSNTLTLTAVRQMEKEDRYRQQQLQRERQARHHSYQASQDLDDMETGFDLPDGRTSLQERLDRVRMRREQQVYNYKVQDSAVEDEFLDEESLGFRAGSSLSQSSMFASQSSTNDIEEGLADDELGSQLDVFGEGRDVLQTRLKNTLTRLQNDAAYELEQEQQRKKYDTVGSNGSSGKGSTRSRFSDEADMDDEDLFGDFAENCENILSNPGDTLHHNVVINNSVKGKKAGRGFIPSDLFRPREARKSSVSTRPGLPALPRVLSTYGSVKAKNMAALSEEYVDPDVTLPVQSSSRPKNLRSTQSMANILDKHSGSSSSAKTKTSRSSRRPKLYGSGFELEVLDELPTNDFEERKFMVTPRKHTAVQHLPLEMYRERPTMKRGLSHKSSTKGDSNERSAGRPKKSSTRNRMGLIRNLGSTLDNETSGMTWNASKGVWDGNEMELKKFDSIKGKKPGLITNKSGKGIEVYGHMKFDPNQMKWISMEGEEDPFDGLEDLAEESCASTPTLRGHHHSYSTDFGQMNQTISARYNDDRRVYSMRTNPVSNLAGSTSLHEQRKAGEEFLITASMIDKAHKEHERFQRKTRAFCTSDDELDRDSLWLVRDMVMKVYQN